MKMRPVLVPGRLLEALEGAVVDGSFGFRIGSNLMLSSLPEGRMPANLIVRRGSESDGNQSPPGADQKPGDMSDAFRSIFQRYGKPIHAFIYHLIGDRGRAEELTQETFFRAYRAIDRKQGPAQLSTWLFGIARNVTREAIREKRRRLRLVGLEGTASEKVHDERVGPDEHFLSGELERAIRQAIEELSDDQRAVFVLKILNKMSYQEISVITGSSPGKLKTDLHRARLQLRLRLQPYLAGRPSRM